MPTPDFPKLIDCGTCSLHIVTPNNVWFIEELFRFADVRKFYVLRSDHAANIKLFCQYVLNATSQKYTLNYIIYNNYGDEAGFISAEPTMNPMTNMPTWNMGYAVHPTHRQRGYATSAVNALTNFLLHNFSLQNVMLDICEENHHSIKVAQKCGFRKPNDGMGYFDMQNPELGMRMRWFKQLAGERTSYFNLAVQYYRQKAYAPSVEAFKQALSVPYQPGTPYTDAQIYSNMGMALSSLERYNEAFQCLKKAQSLGLNNPSIEKELNWLRNNIGLY
ncbi:MAG: GNAT family N-acetyltransferase [Bacteroidaceae bacterium]|nr:GNAT family N-acetyltransferase [Bacteroidaceae bacterium]